MLMLTMLLRILLDMMMPMLMMKKVLITKALRVMNINVVRVGQ